MRTVRQRCQHRKDKLGGRRGCTLELRILAMSMRMEARCDKSAMLLSVPMPLPSVLPILTQYPEDVHLCGSWPSTRPFVCRSDPSNYGAVSWRQLRGLRKGVKWSMAGASEPVVTFPNMKASAL